MGMRSQKNPSKIMAVFAGAAALAFSSVHPGADASDLVSGASAEMLSQTCAGCHGVDGASGGPAIPSIGGMFDEYFIELMEGYKSGEVYATIMDRIAKAYTEEEIALMAEYFAGKAFKPAKQEFDESLVEAGMQNHDRFCEKCHSEGGTILEDEEYFILAGQWTPYVENAMEDFIEGRREMPRKMKGRVEKLLEREGEEGLKAIYAYYASQQKGAEEKQ